MSLKELILGANKKLDRNDLLFWIGIILLTYCIISEANGAVISATPYLSLTGLIGGMEYFKRQNR